MKKILFTLFATLTIFMSNTFAGEMKEGTYGLGWYSASAPVGGRYWVSPKIGLDIGLGFADKNVLGAQDSRFHLNLGAIFNVVETEKANFFIRPGLEMQTNARTDANGKAASKMIISADLGAEYFLTDHLSLSYGHGLQIEQVKGSDDLGISALRALGADNLGFHFYFNK